MPEANDHVHCAECFAAIPTTVTADDGVVTPAQIHLGQQGFIKPIPTGPPEVGVRPVPLCDACADRIQAQEAKSRLLVPKPADLVALPGNGRP